MSEDLTMKGLRGAAKAGDGYANYILARLERKEMEMKEYRVVLKLYMDIEADSIEEALSKAETSGNELREKCHYASVVYSEVEIAE